jgi:flagellar protein FliS
MLIQNVRQYQQTQVMTSSRVQIVVLLYDAAIGELNSVLDFEQGGEIARSLHRLYEYMLSELLTANVRNDVRHLDGPLRCLTTLREGWREIVAQQTRMAGVR